MLFLFLVASDTFTNQHTMRGLFLLLALTFCGAAAMGQIGVRDSYATGYKPKYDSTKNFITDKKDLQAMVGQEILILPPAQGKTEVYEVNNLTVNKHPLWSRFLLSYSPMKYHSYVSGKYYMITAIEVVEVDKTKYHFMTLVERDKGKKKKPDKVYYNLGVASVSHIVTYNAPFLTVGFLEKLKRKYLGKTLISTASHSKPYYDIDTDEDIYVKEGDRVVCVDITLVNGRNYFYLQPSYILQTESGNEYAVPFKAFTGDLYVSAPLEGYKVIDGY